MTLIRLFKKIIQVSIHFIVFYKKFLNFLKVNYASKTLGHANGLVYVEGCGSLKVADFTFILFNNSCCNITLFNFKVYVIG